MCLMTSAAKELRACLFHIASSFVSRRFFTFFIVTWEILLTPVVAMREMEITQFLFKPHQPTHKQNYESVYYSSPIEQYSITLVSYSNFKENEETIGQSVAKKASKSIFAFMNVQCMENMASSALGMPVLLVG
ncbi:hypothetical protein OUZ56_005500 [Daphnia magna]|uniref:Uncharacterized protein n=1 Tax=Daphnia magna TaxID=35525 RepID=A0ABQ9YTG1_9CRUS|nr:hypothetical protein OUZ56_005500 [Daphnia magna]